MGKMLDEKNIDIRVEIWESLKSLLLNIVY